MKYKLHSPSINWPERCASCCGPAEEVVETSCQIPKKIGLSLSAGAWTVSSDRVTIKYPVCSEHKRKSQLAGLMSQRGMGNLLFLSLAILSSLCFLISIAEYSRGTASFLTLVLFLLMPTLYAVASHFGKKNTPVKVLGFTEGSLVLDIQNQTYFGMFWRANH